MSQTLRRQQVKDQAAREAFSRKEAAARAEAKGKAARELSAQIGRRGATKQSRVSQRTWPGLGRRGR